MPAPLAITLHASAAETAGGAGAAVDLWGEDNVETRRLIEGTLTVTAITGTSASLGVVLDTSADGTSWRQVDALLVMPASGVQKFSAGDFDRYARARWTLTAGAEATFALAGTALETFCTLSELPELGAAGTAIGALPKATRIRHLTAATQVARGYLSRRFVEPFLRVGRDVAQAVAKIASLSLLTDVHGINPHTEATALAVQAAEARERWLRDVSRGIAGADVTDSTPETHEGSGVVVTGTSRGFGSMTVL